MRALNVIRMANAKADHCFLGEKVWSLMVKLKFSEEQYLRHFEHLWKPMADHVKEHEPNTVSYELIHSDKDPLEILSPKPAVPRARARQSFLFQPYIYIYIWPCPF